MKKFIKVMKVMIKVMREFIALIPACNKMCEENL